VEESRQAYKDIDSVMANQADLVQPITKLTPLAVLKA
jgi:RNA-splicing ligase RtcB